MAPATDLTRSLGITRQRVNAAIQIDLVRGLIAAVLLTLMLLAHVSLWWALALALIGYGGLRMLARRPELSTDLDRAPTRPLNIHEAWAQCAERRQDLEKLSAAFIDDQTAPRLLHVRTRIDQLMSAIAEDGQYRAAPTLLDLMDTTILLLNPYAKALRRGVGGADVHGDLIQDLTILEQGLDLLWARVNQETIANLAAIREMIRLNHGDLNSTPTLGGDR